MILYHGSNLSVKEPKIMRSNRALDFGTAFYTTTDYEQAKSWALRTKRRHNSGAAVINEYEIDDEVIKTLDILEFKEPDEKWLKLVSAYRTSENVAGEYDLIIGPVADDNTIETISLYLIGMYDEQETIRRLMTFKLKDQIAFKTKKALDLLKFRREIYV